MAVYSVIILEGLTALRGRGFDLHERAARRRPDIGNYAVPAILTGDEIQGLEVEGYRVVVEEDAERYTVERAAEVGQGVNRLAERSGFPDQDHGAGRGERAPQTGGCSRETGTAHGPVQP